MSFAGEYRGWEINPKFPWLDILANCTGSGGKWPRLRVEPVHTRGWASLKDKEHPTHVCPGFGLTKNETAFLRDAWTYVQKISHKRVDMPGQAVGYKTYLDMVLDRFDEGITEALEFGVLLHLDHDPILQNSTLYEQKYVWPLFALHQAMRSEVAHALLMQSQHVCLPLKKTGWDMFWDAAGWPASYKPTSCGPLSADEQKQISDALWIEETHNMLKDVGWNGSLYLINDKNLTIGVDFGNAFALAVARCQASVCTQ